MPLLLVRNDITKMAVDAIVNAANPSLLGGGGVDGAIHRAAGPQLLAECRTLGGCRTGEAKITGAYRLNARYVIHTVGPIWRGGENGEEHLLRSCYRRSLELAADHGCEAVAFPLISSGVYGYPKADAFRVATEAITAFLSDHDLTVYLVLFDKTAFLLGGDRFGAVQSFIDDAYAEEELKRPRNQYNYRWETEARAPLEGDTGELFAPSAMGDACAPLGGDTGELFATSALQDACAPLEEDTGELFAPSDLEDAGAPLEGDTGESAPSALEDVWAYEYEAAPRPPAAPKAAAKKPILSGLHKKAREEDLQRMLRQLDEGFSRTLLRLIDEKGMTDVECYKRANISRKLFSKIRSDPQYKPSKTTAVAFALALELTLPETQALLSRAGYTLSRSYLGDVIIEYCLREGIYNVLTVNELLFSHDQPLLGS